MTLGLFAHFSRLAGACFRQKHDSRMSKKLTPAEGRTQAPFV